jgi:hypothetical protein
LAAVLLFLAVSSRGQAPFPKKDEIKQFSGICFKMLIGADDANMYYYNQHMIDKYSPNGFLPADLNRLSR